VAGQQRRQLGIHLWLGEIELHELDFPLPPRGQGWRADIERENFSDARVFLEPSQQLATEERASPGDRDEVEVKSGMSFPEIAARAASWRAGRTCG